MIILMADNKSPHQKVKASNKASKKQTQKQSQQRQQQEQQASFGIPQFRLPSDFHEDPDRYELWTLRLPSELPLERLEGVELNPKDESLQFTSNNDQYQVTWGNSVENDSFRLLAAAKNDSAADDDSQEEPSSDDKDKSLYPVTRSFSRHINVTKCFEKLDERTLAPTKEQAPTAADPLRIAYTPVAQRTNLRRRWQMPGAGVQLDSAVAQKSPPATKRRRSETQQESASKEDNEEERKPPAKRKLSDTSITERDDGDVNDKEAKKAAKRAKKEAKKARKEAKKAKKAKKAEKKVKMEE